MTDAIRPLIAGNWKMNGLKASMAEFEAMLAGAAGAGRQGRFAGLPAGDADRGFRRQGPRLESSRSAARIAIPRPPAPIPAIFRPKCWRMPAPAPSSSAIPSGAPTMARATRWSGKRRKPPGGRGLPPSSASARPSEQRDAGQTLDVCGGQLKGSLPDGSTAANLVVAYEPVWAIGTGLTPTAQDVEQVHRFIRGVLADRFSGGGGQDPDPLWRLGQALECRPN